MRTIALLALAIAGIGAFEGCASDNNTGYHGSQLGSDGGTCDLRFCSSQFGAPCCINGHCGVNLNGNGCVDLGHRDGG